MKKQSSKKKKTSSKLHKVKICSLTELIAAIAKTQQAKKSIMLHIYGDDIYSAENILKDSCIIYSRIKLGNELCRLELFPSQEKKQSLDDIVNDFMSQFEEI
jgi:hypothetical protein